ncbi:MAG: SDR family oxidoreductase, partial [Chloroflexota bacterium]|nr:SDR family oxidoreductase [Chloroflexota bacterium]
FNAIVPYLIRTESVDAAMKANPALEQEAQSLTPLGRLGTPEEVAAQGTYTGEYLKRALATQS